MVIIAKTTKDDDVEQLIITALWFRFINDSVLQEIFNNSQVRIRHVWARKNERCPYLVHRLNTNNLPDDWVLRGGIYLLDFWDFSNTAEKIYKIKRRVIEILDKSVFGFLKNADYFYSGSQPVIGDTVFYITQPQKGEPLPEVICGRFFWNTGDMIPEDTENIWHYATEWEVKFTRTKSEIEAIFGL